MTMTRPSTVLIPSPCSSEAVYRYTSKVIPSTHSSEPSRRNIHYLYSPSFPVHCLRQCKSVTRWSTGLQRRSHIKEPLPLYLPLPINAQSSSNHHQHQRAYYHTSRILYATKGPFDPYKILGLTTEASQDEIKKAYRRLALKYHPDRPGTGNEAKFRDINEAYNSIKDGNTWSGASSSSEDNSDPNKYHWKRKVKTYNRKGEETTYEMHYAYSYEEPGSTTENYFSNNKRQERFAQLVLIWCAGFVVLRVSLLIFFPNKKNNNSQEPSIAAYKR